MRNLPMRILVVWLLVWIAAAPSRALAQPASRPEPALWRDMVLKLEPGAQITVRLKDGSRRTGTVLHVDDETFTFKARTRIPVPARDLAFADVEAIERQKGNMSPGKKVLLGVGVGTAVYLVVTALLFAALGGD